MKKLLLLLVILTGCNAPHPQEGGGARTRIPQMPPEHIQSVEQALMQPENPEGTSEMFYEESRTVLHPDGRVETTVRKSGTKVGGSQDYARIIKEYAKTDYFKGLFVGLVLFSCAFWAYRNEWPLVALCLAAGGAASIFIVWWAGAVGILAGAGLYVGFKLGYPIPPKL